MPCRETGETGETGETHETIQKKRKLPLIKPGQKTWEDFRKIRIFRNEKKK